MSCRLLWRIIFTSKRGEKVNNKYNFSHSCWISIAERCILFSSPVNRKYIKEREITFFFLLPTESTNKVIHFPVIRFADCNASFFSPPFTKVKAPKNVQKNIPSVTNNWQDQRFPNVHFAVSPRKKVFFCEDYLLFFRTRFQLATPLVLEFVEMSDFFNVKHSQHSL